MDSDREMANSASESTDIVLNSIENRSNEKPIWITCYMNGNSNFPGKKVLYTKKNYKTDDKFYDEITRALPANRSVVGLGTPNRGSRIRSLQELQTGERYVALIGDKFEPLPYTSIEDRPRKSPRRNPLEPVKKNPKFKDICGKIHQTNINGLKIHVWPNRDVIQRPHPISLLPWQLNDMDLVIREVGDRLDRLCAGPGPIMKLHDRKGREVHHPSELVADECYVAVRYHDHFRQMRYSEREKPNIMTSRQIHKKDLPPLIFSRGSKNSKGWSPNTSGHSSYPDSENSYRERHKRNRFNRQSREHREEDDVFPRKPVTHKRSSERRDRREVDLDKDEGGVFKAKHGNRYTQGAREIRDTRDTKVDLPIDQVPAEEVKDEEPGAYEASDDKTAPVPSGVELTKLPSEQTSEDLASQEENERIRGKPNSDYNQKNKSKDVKNGKAGNNSLVGKNGYKQNPRGADTRSPRNKEKLGNSDRNHGMNGYDDRYSPHRSPSPVESPDWQNNRNNGYNSSPRRSPSPRQTYSRESEKEEAAVKIQSHMKGYLTRKNDDQSDERGDDQDKHNQNDDFLQRERDEAATKIQSHIRGYQVRKNNAVRKAERAASAGRRSAERMMSAGRRSSGRMSRELSLDMPVPFDQGRSQRSPSPNGDYKEPGPTDEEREAAATKIQANFRGYQTRKDFKNGR